MNHQGQKLKKYIHANGWAFTKAAKELNISLEELKSYFDNAYLDEEIFRHVCITLILYPISQEPYSISVEALEQMKLLEGLVKSSAALDIEAADAIKSQMDEISRLKNIIKHKNETIDLFSDKYLKSISEIKRLERLKEPSLSEFFNQRLLKSKNYFLNLFTSKHKNLK